jgi:hypothetical protein
MATSDSTAPATGKNATVPAIDAINAVELAMLQIKYMRNLFTAIKLMAPEAAHLPLSGLSEQGRFWADAAHNDLDCFREDLEAMRAAPSA